MVGQASSHLLKFPVENHILAALPKEEYGRLLPHLEPVRLPQGKILWDVGDPMRHAYFLSGGMTSLLAVTADGGSVEVGMVGNEGLAGVASVLHVNVAPYRVVVQLPSSAMRISADVLVREFNRRGRLADLLLRYVHTLLTHISQSAACHRFHTAEERLCRWLLVSRDRAQSDNLPLTQEFLSQMIGAPRTSVTTIAGKLQKLGFVRHSRGKIRILNARGLEAFSCECYQVVSEGISRFLAA